ncbi:dihydrofolate reductase family protein [Angustibacter peucedani]
MGTIAVHEFVALDGVFENPSWTAPFGFDPRMGETLADITGSSSAILLGRSTYEMFAPAWSTRTVEDDPGAPFFNDTHKYVVGAQEPDVDWGPRTLLGAYDPAAIGRLKDETDGGIYVSGSGRLVNAMLQDGLVDALHLFVYPVAVGSGQRLFADGVPTTTLALAGADVYDNGVVHLEYEPA